MRQGQTIEVIDGAEAVQGDRGTLELGFRIE
jgi:hypothetical protein